MFARSLEQGVICQRNVHLQISLIRLQLRKLGWGWVGYFELVRARNSKRLPTTITMAH